MWLCPCRHPLKTYGFLGRAQETATSCIMPIEATNWILSNGWSSHEHRLSKFLNNCYNSHQSSDDDAAPVGFESFFFINAATLSSSPTCLAAATSSLWAEVRERGGEGVLTGSLIDASLAAFDSVMTALEQCCGTPVQCSRYLVEGVQPETPRQNLQNKWIVSQYEQSGVRWPMWFQYSDGTLSEAKHWS